MDGKKLLETFNQLNIDTNGITAESLNYLFTETSTRELLEFFCENVNSDNILSNEEIEDYEYLQENDLVIDNEVLEKVTLEIEKSHPGIFNIEEKDIVVLEQTVHEHLEILDDIKYLIDINKVEETNLNEDIFNLGKTYLNYVHECNSLSSKCLEISKYLNNMHNDLYQFIEKMINSITSSTNLCEMPVQSYYNEYETFKTELRKCLSRCFSTSTFSVSTDTFKGMIENYRILITEAIVDNILQKFSYNYQTLMVQNYYKLEKTNFSKILSESESERQKEHIEVLEKEISEIFDNDLPSISSEFANIEIKKTLSICRKHNLERHKELLENLKFINNDIDYTENHYNLICSLMDGEIEYMNAPKKLIRDFIECYSTFKENGNKRMEIMQSNVRKYELIKNKSIFDRFPAVRSMSSILMCDEALSSLNTQKLHDSISILENKLYSENDILWKLSLKPIQCKLDLFNKFLYNGPTKQPIIVDIPLSKCLFETDKNFQNLSMEFKKLIEQFTVYNKKLTDDKWLNIRQKLWILFLTNPGKIVEEIEKLQAHLLTKP